MAMLVYQRVFVALEALVPTDPISKALRHSAFLAAAFFFASACVKQKRAENFRGKPW